MAENLFLSLHIAHWLLNLL